MIQFVLIIPEKERAEEVIDLLVGNNLVMDMITHSEHESIGKRLKITGVTRAILYPQIEKLLSELFNENEHILYSLPIVNMDCNNAQMILSNTKIPVNE
ncbi:MAG: hypothetical protein MK078_08545 [Crocinitomicaceae bacterium]|nr:hypothetical protein [Crocinitomicaceae bacterium]